MDELEAWSRQKDAERRAAARAMTFEQRALAGVAMFDICAAAMRAGIRITHASLNADGVEAELVRRLRLSRRHEATR
jgi:hypothetical protein